MILFVRFAEQAKNNSQRYKNIGIPYRAQVRKKRTMKKTASYGRIKETTIGGIFYAEKIRTYARL